MLTGLHFLLTYQCTSTCDHCFLYCGPDAGGTFTVRHLREALDEAVAVGTVEMIFFEGGEPFLFYPVMLEGIKLARERGFETGVVTNSYWATAAEDAARWLQPLRELAVSDISVSDDAFHYGEDEYNPARTAREAAAALGLAAGSICIERPKAGAGGQKSRERGAPVIGGGVMFRGRAVEKLTPDLPLRRWDELTSCPHEDLRDPKRVHLDAYGHVHLCQGLSMGNMWETPLSALVRAYDAEAHPICGPLLRGGPALLAQTYGVEHAEGYVDECHLCYLARLALVDKFPRYLAPRQVYGLG